MEGRRLDLGVLDERRPGDYLLVVYHDKYLEHHTWYLLAPDPIVGEMSVSAQIEEPWRGWRSFASKMILFNERPDKNPPSPGFLRAGI